MNLFEKNRGKLFGHASSLFFCISVLLLDVSLVFLYVCSFFLLHSWRVFHVFAASQFPFSFNSVGVGKSLSVDLLLGDVQGEVNIPDR